MSPVLITYPTWQEMFGKRPTESELLDAIRPLDRLHTVWLLARINLLLALDRYHADPAKTADLQTYLVKFFFDEELFEQLKKRYDRERRIDRQSIHSLQILTLMKKVMLEGAKTGGLRPDADKEAAHRLGRCLIMVNDFLFTKENARATRQDRPSGKRRKIALQLQVGSGLEINNPPAINKSIVRSDIIFGDILKKIPGSLDAAGAFHRRTGLTLEDYVDHVFGLLAYYIILDSRKLIEEPGLACINFATFFAEAPKGPVEAFWRMEVATVDNLEASLLKPSDLKLHHDFIVFRQNPLLQVAEDNAVPVHLGFVQEKLEAGLFWAIFNSLGTSEERALLFTDWGHLYEEYVSQVLARCFSESAETYFPFPKFSDNKEEAFDGVVAADKYWVVMEYKGGFLSARAKYAEDEEGFLEDLERKFGAKKGAGIEQLVRKVAAVFAARPNQKRSLTGIDSSNVRVVVPLLIVQEPFVSSEITVPYLIDLFGSLKRKEKLDPKIICTFPIVLDVSEIESLKPYLAQKKISFIDCIMERVRMGGSGFLSFRDFLREYLEKKHIERIRDDELTARFRLIMNRISERFFKRPFEPGAGDPRAGGQHAPNR